jgi:hypothetical protein
MAPRSRDAAQSSVRARWWRGQLAGADGCTEGTAALKLNFGLTSGHQLHRAQHVPMSVIPSIDGASGLGGRRSLGSHRTQGHHGVVDVISPHRVENARDAAR